MVNERFSVGENSEGADGAIQVDPCSLQVAQKTSVREGDYTDKWKSLSVVNELAIWRESRINRWRSPGTVLTSCDECYTSFM
jgi:hypothetical protein